MKKTTVLFLLALCCAAPLAAQSVPPSFAARVSNALYALLGKSEQQARQDAYRKNYQAWISFLKNRRSVSSAVKENRRQAVLQRLLGLRSLPDFFPALTSREKYLLDVRRGLRLGEMTDCRTFKQELRETRRLENHIKRTTQNLYNDLQKELDDNPLMHSLVLSPEAEVLFSRARYAVNAPGERPVYAAPPDIARRLFAVQTRLNGVPQKHPVFAQHITVNGSRAELTFRPLSSGAKRPQDLVFTFDAEQGFVFVRLIPR